MLGEGFTFMAIRDFAGHMSYMEVLADTGVVGLILFTSLWYHVLTAPRRIVSSAETTMQFVIGRAAVWISIAFLVASAAIGLIFQNTYRLLFMIWLCLALAPAWELIPEQVYEDSAEGYLSQSWQLEEPEIIYE